MTTESNFDPSKVKPAMVNFIDSDEQNDQEEHLDGLSTPATVEDTQDEPVAPVNQAPDTKPVHAETQDSDERYRNLQAAYTKVSQENSELRRTIQHLEQSIPQNQYVQSEPATPAEPDELDNIVNEFPELEPIASRMKEFKRKMDAQQAAIDQTQESMNRNAQETAQERQNRTILAAHNDAYEIAGSIDFSGWLQRQPSYMHSWMNTGTAEQVIDLLTAYKVAAGRSPQQQPPKQNPVDEARMAGSPSKNGSPIINTNDSKKRTWTAAEIDAMDYAEYQTLEQELDLAAREGRIIG